ncbi:MAG: subtilisin family serine protease, partial [Myxococcota bacterium]
GALYANAVFHPGVAPMFWWLLPMMSSAGELPLLYRVDVPDYPGALTTSTRGSLLDHPPEDLPWRHESLAEVDEEIVPQGETQAWEALDAMGVRAWHEAGYDGSGVKIAVFDVQWYGAELDGAELGDFETHDCFIHRSCEQPIDTLRPTFAFETGSHGVACAEVIRDIAPGAELHLVRVSGLTTLESAVDWAIREEIDLISMSLSFFNESFYDGTGSVNALIPPLAAAGALMVTSAGNYADQHFSGTFSDEDTDGYHDFDGSSELRVYLFPGRSTIYLLWDQFRDCGRSDLDLFVVDSAGDVVGWGANEQSVSADSCFPGERLSAFAETEGWYGIRIRKSGGAGDTRFDVHVRRGELEVYTGGSITDPGTSPLALTVGAIRATEYASAGVEPFSSLGPTSSGLAKPDIAGPDGLSSTVYGPTGFFGTSASTPAVAGALALIMSREPDIDSYAAARRLQSWARAPQGAATWSAPDPGEGAGRARLPDPAHLEGGCAGGRQAMAGLALPLWVVGVRRRRRRR